MKNKVARRTAKAQALCRPAQRVSVGPTIKASGRTRYRPTVKDGTPALAGVSPSSGGARRQNSQREGRGGDRLELVGETLYERGAP